MTPGARYAAAIEILDRTMEGAPAERELTSWARGNRFAGSKDRAVIRDIVFDGLRNLRSYAHLSGLDGARGVLIGRVLALGETPQSVFNGQGYAPALLDAHELDMVAAPKPDMSRAVSLDVPDWLEPLFSRDDDYALLKSRAPIDLRVNLHKSDLSRAKTSLAREGIEVDMLDTVPTALRVRGETRKVPQTAAYLNGSVELQDAGSQALVLALDIPDAGKVLDYCAGGGGKTLAMAALASPDVNFYAYDGDPKRLKALKDRAKRAGVQVQSVVHDPAKSDETYDLVVLDVPCSGSGAWRRTPDAKWKISPERLAELTQVQAEILNNTKGLVGEGGALAYMTCSLFAQENEQQIDRFLKANPTWKQEKSQHIPLAGGTDGFFISILKQ